MNDEPDVRRLLEAAVRHEPPLGLDRDAVVEEGRRRLRVRRTATVGGAAMAVVAVVLGMTALSGANLGLPDEIGPAAPATTAAPVTSALPHSALTTSPPQSAGSREAPVAVTTNTRAPTSAGRPDLGVVLLRAPVAWPAGVRREGEGGEWFAFDEKGVAAFHLVAADESRRMVRVQVAGDGSFAEPACPVETCQEHVEADGTRLFVTTEPAEQRGGLSTTVVALRPGGVHVRVVETAGVGPPWRPKPLLDEATLVSLATLPGFDGVKR